MLKNYFRPSLIVAASRANNSMILKLVAAILVANCLLGSTKPRLFASGLQQQQQQQPSARSATENQSKSRQQYFGTYIGRLQARRDHNISGDVFAVDEQTLFIRRFNYDGQAPDAYFWSSVVAQLPSGPDGFIVPDEKGSTKPLERYSAKDIVLRLPEGKTLREINWLSVWSRQHNDNLADILIEKTLIMPRPLEIGPLTVAGPQATGANTHGVRSGPITIVDAQTFLVPDLHYDGSAPDAYFWLTRGGHGLSPLGIKLKDENGSGQALRKYSGETVVISLPDEQTIYDFDYFGLWCREFSVNFGQVKIPQQARVPPSPKMLGIKPENKLNCEILYDDLGYEIRWVLDGDDIVMQLVGKIEPAEYMAFGLGKNDSRSEMSNADAVVAWVERQTGQVHAVDYYLGGKQQCPAAAATAAATGAEEQPTRASCPDSQLPGGGDSLTLLHGAIVNGYSMVTFKRPQLGIDELYDQHVYSDGQQSVMWAIGQLNERKEVGYHRLRTRGNMFIDFARNPQWNCPIPDLNATMSNNLPAVSASASQLDPTFTMGASSSMSSSRQRPEPLAAAVIPASGAAEPATAASSSEQGWFVPSIVCPQDRTFHAQIGPTGGKRGYESITGRPGWGVSWYINGVMIPELVVERGQSYRFIVEGGNDKTSAPRRHPLYLTDSQEGGFHFKTDDERLRERIYAGVALRGDGQFVPMAEGRLCEWRTTNQTLQNADLYQTFSAYQRSLKLECEKPSNGGGHQAAVLKFSPDSSTPDTLYYQCYTHRFMGWRIRVVDSCAAYLATGPSASPRLRSASSNNNNNKRDLSVSQSARQQTYSRRNSYDAQSVATTGELFGPSDQLLEGLFSTEMQGLESGTGDMLILNNSQLHQKQPYNLSSFDEVLKLSPADLEFLDQQDLQQLLLQNQNPTSNQLPPQLALQLALLNQMNADPAQFNQLQLQQQQQLQQQPFASHKQTANKTTKMPKTLQSYMRRLASIYYPVQQQLASILSNQQHQNSSTSLSTANNQQSPHSGSQQQQQQQVMTSESAPGGSTASSGGSSSNSAAFSLASLMPTKPKIDLSKSTLTRKFNKLRFKTGRKLEPTGSSSSGPPRPANEFNYDIFNNQLAQLEKQQKQLQSFEFNWQQQQPSESFLQQQQQQQPLMFPLLAHTNGGFVMEQPVAAEQLNYQSSMISNTNNMYVPAQQQQQQQQQRPRVTSQPGNVYPSQRQPARLELSLSFANRSRPQQQQWPPFNQLSGQTSDEHAIFITRLPQPLAFAPQYPMPANWQQQQSSGSGQVSARYPGIQPYAMMQQQQDHLTRRPFISHTDSPQQQQQQQDGHLSSMPSLALTVHSDQTSKSLHPKGNEMGDKLTSSDSGSMYEFRQQQPSDQIKLMQSDQSSDPGDSSDHMLAIERFSKLPSERRQPSIVHPVTGEHVLYVDKTHNQSLPGRFSHLLADNSAAPQFEILDSEQSVQYDHQSSDLQRLNSIGSSSSSRSTTTGKQPEGENRLAKTVEPFLVKPVISQDLNQRDKSSNTLAATTTTVASTTELASTQMSPPSMTTPLQESNGQLQFSQPSYSTPATTTTTTTTTTATTTAPLLKSNLVEPIRSTLVHGQTNVLDGGFINAFNNPTISQLNFDSSPFMPMEFNPFYQQASSLMASRLRPPSLIESMYHGQERPEPPVQVASYLSQHLAGHNPLLYMTSEKSVASKNPMALNVALPLGTNQAGSAAINNNNHNSPLARLSNTNDLIILKPSTLTRDNTYILKPEYISTSPVNSNNNKNNQPTRFSQEEQSSPEDPYNINSIGDQNEASRRLVGIQFDRLSSLSSPPSTSIALDPLQTSHTINSYNVEHIDTESQTKGQQPGHKQKQAKDTSFNSSSSFETNNIKTPSQHRQTSSIQIPLTSVFEPAQMGATSSNTTEGVRTNPGGPNSNTLLRDNNTDNAILSHVMSLISSNAIPTPPIVPVASYSNADYFLPSSDRIYRSIRGGFT